MKTWTADLVGRTNLCIQAADPSRATNDANGALCLTTLPGDDHVVYSGPMRRCDGYARIPGTLDPQTYGEGESMWVNHAVLFPSDFQQGRWHPYIVFDFHGVDDPALAKAIAANLHVNFRAVEDDPTALGRLQIQGYYGDPTKPTEYHAVLGAIERNRWYNFLHHVLWTSARTGYLRSWLNGRLVMNHRGPTLFQDRRRVYLKIANYHLPVTQAEQDQLGWAPTPASSVWHDRVRIGSTIEAVTG